MYKLFEIAEALGCEYDGNADLEFSAPAEPRLASSNEIAMALEPNYIQQLKTTKARAAIVPFGFNWEKIGLDGVIFALKPKQTLLHLTNFFAVLIDIDEGVHPSCLISENTLIGKGSKVGAFVSIGKNCSIGENVQIDSHTSIGNSVTIGENCIIHSGVRIGTRSKIGDRVIIHQNVVISSDGFSFIPIGEKEEYQVNENDSLKNFSEHGRVASLGAVIIKNDVEIGANSCLDRGTIKDTIIGRGTKIDNLVHIGHNVSIGENCLICGQVGIAGSTVVEDRVIMGGQVGVADNLKIGHDTVLAGKTGVSANVPSNQFMMGSPAMKMETNVQAYKAFRRLPRLNKKIRDLEKLVSKFS